MVRLKKYSKIRFLHLIDHDGTIFRLISPLSKFPEQYIIESFSSSNEANIKLINKLAKNKELICILHATGNNKYFYNIKKDLIKKFKNFYIFLHVSPNHFLIKKRMPELNNLKKIAKEYKIKILVPSKEIKKNICIIN